MFAVLSPAKKQDFSPAPPGLPGHEPPLIEHVTQLMRTTSELTEPKIARLMKVSPSLAKLTRDRFQALSMPLTRANAVQAALAFAGDVGVGLQGRTLGDSDLRWAQSRAGFLSGLYGLLRPLDLMQPYRLEMGTGLQTPRGRNLYAFWGDLVARQIRREVSGHRDPTLINLASDEYFKVIPLSALRLPVKTLVFEEVDNGAPKMVVVCAKQARGLVARFLIENRLETAEQLKAFNISGYRFEQRASSADRWVFRRPFVPAAKRR